MAWSFERLASTALVITIGLAVFGWIVGFPGQEGALSETGGKGKSYFRDVEQKIREGKEDELISSQAEVPEEIQRAFLRFTSNFKQESGKNECILTGEFPDLGDYSVYVSSANGISLIAFLKDSSGRHAAKVEIEGANPCVIFGSTAAEFYNEYLGSGAEFEDTNSSKLFYSGEGISVDGETFYDLNSKDYMYKKDNNTVCFMPDRGTTLLDRLSYYVNGYECEIVEGALSSQCFEDIENGRSRIEFC